MFNTSAFIFLCLAIGKLTFHESASSTFEEARKTCLQGGGELVRDIDFLKLKKTGITNKMIRENITSAWIGKHLFPLNNGMFCTD